MPKVRHTGDAVVSRNIRQARLEQGLSQEKVASALGVSFQQLQKYENASNRVSAGTLVEIAKALGVSPARLLGGNGADEGPTLAERLCMTRQGAELAKAFVEIGSNTTRQAVLDLVKAVAASVAARH